MKKYELTDNTILYKGHTLEVCGGTRVCGNVNLYTGTISSSDQILTIEPIGSRDDEIGRAHV